MSDSLSKVEFFRQSLLESMGGFEAVAAALPDSGAATSPKQRARAKDLMLRQVISAPEFEVDPNFRTTG